MQSLVCRGRDFQREGAAVEDALLPQVQYLALTGRERMSASEEQKYSCSSLEVAVTQLNVQKSSNTQCITCPLHYFFTAELNTERHKGSR